MVARRNPESSEWRATHEADALSAPVMQFDLSKEIESLMGEPHFAGCGTAGKTRAWADLPAHGGSSQPAERI